MKNSKFVFIGLLLCFLSGIISRVSALDSLKKVDLDFGMQYFFDNDEFERSTLTIPQTMTGIHLVPVLKYKFDEKLSFHAGVDVLSLAGSEKTIDTINVLGWLKYSTRRSDLYAGSFLKNELLSDYSEFFFNDSSRYFRNVMKGVFWRIHKNNNYLNFWLDWTGMQTKYNRETFFVGSSAQWVKRNLFMGYQAYMFHFATAGDKNYGQYLTDNALLHAEIGYCTTPTVKTKIKLTTGVLFGYENERTGMLDVNKPIGITLTANLGRKFWGIDNLIYVGATRNLLYQKYGDDLYWNSPFLQSRYHLKSEWYVNVVNHKNLKGKLSSVFRISERVLFFEQKLIFDLNM